MSCGRGQPVLSLPFERDVPPASAATLATTNPTRGRVVGGRGRLVFVREIPITFAMMRLTSGRGVELSLLLPLSVAKCRIRYSRHPPGCHRARAVLREIQFDFWKMR